MYNIAHSETYGVVNASAGSRWRTECLMLYYKKALNSQRRLLVGLKVEEIHRPNQGKKMCCIGVHRFR